MNCVTPSALAAQWFPSSQRAVATSTVYAAQMAGPCVGFVVALLLVHQSHLEMKINLGGLQGIY